jgi:hypothetical protein
MLKTVSGTYRNGVVALDENPGLAEETKVLVAFNLEEGGVPLPPHLTKEELIEARWRLQAWEEDWNAPGMELYDKL